MPELGKATYVIEIDSRDFEKGLKRVQQQTKQTTTQTDRDLSKTADSWNKVTLGVTKTNREMGRSKATMTGWRAAVTGANQALSLMGKMLNLIKFPALAAGIGLLVGAVGALSGGAMALVGALSPLVGVAASVGAAFGGMLQAMIAGKLAFSGIGEALKAMGAQQQSAGADASAMAASIRAAANSVRSAEQQLVASHKAVQDAQEALTQAREDAARQLVDMRLAAQGAALGEKRAALSLKQARAAMQDVMSDPAATAIERRDAALSVKEAELSLKSSRVENNRAAEDLNETEAKGVKGSDAVTSARESLAQANLQVANSQRAVTDAQRAMTEAQNSGAASADNLKAAMDKLSPAAQSFAKYLFSLKPQLDRLKASIGAEMFPGLERGLRGAMTNFEMFERVLSGSGAVLGHLGERFGRVMMEGSKFATVMERVGHSNNAAFERMGKAAIHLFKALFHILDAARPLTKWLTESIELWSKNTAQQAKAGAESGKLARFFQHTKEAIKAVIGVLDPFMDALVQIGHLGRNAGMDLFKSMRKTAEQFERWTKSEDGRRRIREFFRNVIPLVKEVGALVGDITKAILRLGEVPVFRRMTSMLRTDLLPVLETVFRETAKAFGPEMIRAITEAAKLFTNLATSGVIKVFMDLSTFALKFLNALFKIDPLIGAMAVGLVGVYKIVKTIGFALWVSQIMGFGKGLQAVIPLMTKILGLSRATAAANAAGQMTLPGMGVPTAGGKLAGFGSKLLKGGLIGGGIAIGGGAIASAVGGEDGEQLGSVASGAGIGATVGSVVPGIGTGIGALAGGIIGGVSGLLGGGPSPEEKIAEWVKQGEEGVAKVSAAWGDFSVEEREAQRTYIEGLRDSGTVTDEWADAQIAALDNARKAHMNFLDERAMKKADALMNGRADSINSLFNEVLKDSGNLGKAINVSSRDMLGTLGNLRGEASNKMGQTYLDMIAKQAKGNPKMERKVAQVTKAMEKRWAKHGRDIKVIQGRVTENTPEMWDKMADKMTSRTERYRQAHQKAFTKVQKEMKQTIQAFEELSGKKARKAVALMERFAGLSKDAAVRAVTQSLMGSNQYAERSAAYANVDLTNSSYDLGGGNGGGKKGGGGQRGGLVTARGILGFAKGGVVPKATGPRSGPMDKIPALLAPGEMVIPKTVVDGTKKNSEEALKILNDNFGKGFKKAAKHTDDFTKKQKKSMKGMEKDTGKTTLDIRNKTTKDFDETRKRASASTNKLRKKSVDELSMARKGMSENAKGAKEAVSSSFNSMSSATASALGKIEDGVNAAMKELGLKGVDFSASGGGSDSGGGGGGGGGDSPQRKQTGGTIVPGRGSGDKVPALLEPGEVVLNREAVRNMGGAYHANKPNRDFHRHATGYATGGTASRKPPPRSKREQDMKKMLRGPEPGYVDSTWAEMGGAPWEHLLPGWSHENWGFAGGFASSAQDLWSMIHGPGGFDTTAFLAHLESTEGNWWSSIGEGYTPGVNYAISGMAGYDWAHPGGSITDVHGNVVDVYPGPPLEFPGGKTPGYEGWGKKGLGTPGYRRGGVARFSGGGVAEPPGDPGSEVVQAAWAQEVGRFMQNYNMNLSQGYNPSGPSVSAGHNILGVPPSLDVVPLDGNWDGRFASGLKWALGQGMNVLYDGQYGTTNLPPHGEGHHAHIDWGQNSGAGSMGGGMPMADLVKKVNIDGPDGPMKDIAQAATDKVLDAANKYIESKQPTSGMTGSGPVERMFAQVAKQLSDSKTATLALGMAGYAESGMQDLPGGHSTSQGALQLLASTAAGLGIDPHDEKAVSSHFLLRGYYGRGGANSLAKSGLPAHLVAQNVQGSAFSDGSNYAAQEGAAKGWMSRYGLRKGGVIHGYERGGVIPGPVGEPRMIVAHGGETVVPPPTRRRVTAHDTSSVANRSPGAAAGGRYELSITNWDQGTGYIRNIAGDEVEMQVSLSDQRGRMSV